MMMHYFLFQDYEFQDYPAAQPLPDLGTRKSDVQEQEWLTLQGHPIAESTRTLEIEYQKYPKDSNYLNPFRRLQIVAYGAHPLFGARATHRLAGMIRVSHHAETEFEAMTLTSDTFAQYPFTLGLAADCAAYAAECAQLADKPAEVVQAWRQQMLRLQAHYSAR